MRQLILSMAIAATLASSCSIKEDRTKCACILVLDMTSCSNAPDNVRLALSTIEEKVELDFIPGQDQPFYEYPVAKGVCSLSAFLCPRELSSGTDRITVELGENCPELFASRSVFEVAGETAEHKVVLHKQFAVVTVDLDESPWDAATCEIAVKGGINGISLTDLKPIKGSFYYEVPKDPGGFRTFRLPRQTRESAAELSLELRAPGGSPQVFDLGEYLAGEGYDWQAEDLQDVVVKIRNSEIVVETRSSDWIIQERDVIVI